MSVDANGAEGYVTEVGYTFGYYAELNPLRAAFSLVLEGLEPPPPGPCCELGFGQGLSLAMHAAANPERRWWGNDLLPAHALHAQHLLGAAGVHAEAAAQSFAEFCARDDLPAFAFIGLHGVWSWVSPANRALIVDFLRRKLMPGGVVFLSFNVMSGWAPLLPLRQLLVDHERLESPPGMDRAARARAARDFTHRVFGLDSIATERAPQLRAHAASLLEHPASYLLHEFMNRDWAPMSLGKLNAQLQTAGLTYAGPTNPGDHVAHLHLTQEQQALLADLHSPVLRADVADVFSGRRFRRDLWQRGQRRLHRSEQLEHLEAMHVVLACDPSEVPRTLTGPFGEATMEPASLDPLLDALVAAGGPMPVGELLRHLAGLGIEVEETLSLLGLLSGSKAVVPALDPARSAAARGATDRLNAQLLWESAARAEISQMASPVTGGAVTVTLPMQGLLLARSQAPGKPDQWPAMALAANQAHGQVLRRDGLPVEDPAEALEMLTTMNRQLVDILLPVLHRLQVVD